MELQYDGTGLHGWAKQDGLVTVEGSLEKAFRTVVGSVPSLRVAGRTDAGVHARRQVVSLCLPKGTDLGRLTASLNALTPPGITIMRMARAADDFDARKNAISRTYRYFLSTAGVVSPFWSRYCWHTQLSLDAHLLAAAAEVAIGRHDFTAFTPVKTEHAYFQRVVLSCAWRRGAGAGPPTATGRGLLCLEIEADSFLRHMVRALVGTMLEVGEGKRNLESYRRLLGGATRETAGRSAPAHGLFLWDVRY
jgi:tRNA pseudouridine38-40 synthase